MSKTMAQLPYHYGVKLRVFPSTEQKRLIKRNSDASRFIYNEMNGMNRELYQLRQVKLPIAIVQQRIQTLEERLKKPATGISNIHGWLKNRDLVMAEELRSKNLLRNHALTLSIADVGWRTFLGMLAYKAKLYGR